MPTHIAALSAQSPTARRVLAVIGGAVLVALSAQVAVPLPGTPVPLTLQPLAVLIVGGLLGPELGAASLVTYLAMGAAGLPVFTPSPLLPQGLGRLFGPTGGYLLAYPVAAYGVGRLVGDGRPSARIALAALAGLALIHVGGLVQLALLTGSISQAARLGTLPFLLGDLLKVALALLILKPTVSPLRARL
ncbi:MAG TPA: biotin transporter BioY [Gemmatimonadales bacterium]|nr:biotin transporter BioY [Gemmatimonadales bacterium]